MADSALYSKQQLQNSIVRWLTRVPNTKKEAKHFKSCSLDVLNDTPDAQGNVTPISDVAPGYQGKLVAGPNNEQWLVQQSEQGYHRDRKAFEQRLQKEEERLETECARFAKERFACAKDAVTAAERHVKKLKWHDAIITPDWHDENSLHPGYAVNVTLKRNPEKMQGDINACGRFILATNDKTLSATEMLREYKGQDGVERGFRFLKDGEYRLNHIFLKSNKCIEALMMVLTLGLLIYNVSQTQIRHLLKANNQYYPDQKRKPTQRPTLRWILQRIGFDRAKLILYDN